VSGDEHNPKVWSQIVLMHAHNFPETASNTVANNRAAQASARNKANASSARILHRESREHHELAACRVAGLFYSIKI
jgi:hypothetical protein